MRAASRASRTPGAQPVPRGRCAYDRHPTPYATVRPPTAHPTPETPLPPASASFVHRAVLYGDDAEAVSVVVAQLAVALRRGDPAVVVLGPALRQAVEETLGSAAAERVHFRDLTDVHTGSVDTMIANYLRIVDELLGGGRMSTIVQYDHEHPHDGTQDFCFRVESAVNIAAARRQVDNTCLYDLRATLADDTTVEQKRVNICQVTEWVINRGSGQTR